MYYIIVYDVNVDRVQKMLKLMREYVNHVQNSVFEGELTDAQLAELKDKSRDLMDEDKDSIIIYRVGSKRWSSREVLGIEKHSADNFVWYIICRRVSARKDQQDDINGKYI